MKVEGLKNGIEFFPVEFTEPGAFFVKDLLGQVGKLES